MATEEEIWKRYVVIKEIYPEVLKIGLKVGPQSFDLDYVAEGHKEAEWMASMLAKALVKIIESEGGK